MGHTARYDYLQVHGGLIAELASALGNIADAYREQYRIPATRGQT
jgi:hypothetical protein